MPFISAAAFQQMVIPTIFVTGGVFPIGSHDFADAPPTWKEVSDFELGETEVTEGQRSAVLETGGDLEDERPANRFSYWAAERFVQRLNAGLSVEERERPYGIPTETEWEYAARGGAPVEVRALMQAEEIEPTHQNLVALAEDKLRGGSGHGLLENFVIGDWPQTAEKRHVEGIRIYTVTASEIEEALRNPELPIRGMWMYASGRAGLSKEAVWYDRGKPAPKAKWGQPNRGLYTMSGNLWEWVADGYEADAYRKTAAKDPRHEPKSKDSSRILRGGSGWGGHPGFVRASYRGYRPDFGGLNVGFRVARSAARDSKKG